MPHNNVLDLCKKAYSLRLTRPGLVIATS